MNLTPDQLKAVQTKSNLLFVNAGPGAGKSRVIVERIRHLIETGTKPSEILAITFTNKAAKVMQERLSAMSIHGVTASTMHALAVRLKIRDGNPFSIFDEDDCYSIIKKLAKAKKIVDKDELYEISNEIALLKDNQIPFNACSSKYKDILLGYEEELGTNNAIDFADLITILISKTGKEDIPWRHVLVDEAQDLSNGQIMVIRNFFGRREDKDTLTLCGDLDQSVYEWRNAKPGIIKKFAEENAEIIPLAINFRSTKSIVNYSKRLISLNKIRIIKPLEAHSKEVGIFPKTRCFSDSLEEAEWVAKLCSNSNDICILYRSNWMSAQLEIALTKARVQYTVSDTVQFLDRKEIKDVLSYVRVAVNSNDLVSLTRSIQSPKRGIGKKALEGIKKFEDIIDNDKMQDYVSIIYNLRERKADAGYAIRGMLFRSQYLGYEDEPDRVRNLDQLITILEGKTLEEAMFELTGGSPTTDVGDSRVHLMTLHSSKGTEYKKVVIIGCEEGITPHINSENLEEERRLFYVGMTRAEQELILSYTRKRLMFGSYNYMQPTRFFKEAGLII